MPEPKELKEEGNTYFKQGKYEDALTCYAKALSLSEEGDKEKATYFKNKAACHLKLEKYSAAIEDTTSALEISPNDPKALFRRCQAYQHLEKYEDAYKDARQLLNVDPKNAAIQPILRQLTMVIQQKTSKVASLDSKVSQMFDLVFNHSSGDNEKRIQAANNLIVLAREESGAEKIVKAGGIPKIIELLSIKDKSLALAAVRVLQCLTKENKERSIEILTKLGMQKILLGIGVPDEDISTAGAYFLQNLIKSISGVSKYNEEKEAHERKKKVDRHLRPFKAFKMEDEEQKMINEIFNAIIGILTSSKISGCGRDSLLEILIKFVARQGGVGWTRTFIEYTEGLYKLMEIAGCIKEYKTMPVTDNSQMHASVALQKLYDDMLADKEREIYREKVDAYFTDNFTDKNIESQVEAVKAVTALLQGPFDIGNHILSREGVLEIMLAMAGSENTLFQKVAIEAMVHSTSKKQKSSGIIKQAVPILKKLYQTENETIKVRALVGLCKLGSIGGTDVSMRSFADGSNTTLAKACRKYLKNPSKDVDLRKWATEGLAYLTLDADVKEDLVDDTPALHSLMDLAKHSDKGILYPAAQVFVNCTNSYDKQDIMPEMLELAKYAKQHVPEEHEKDKSEYVDKRVAKLVKAGIGNALVALSKTDSASSKELLSRAFLAVSYYEENRGLLVQQGAVKALINLSLEGTDVGKILAAQSLAKIGITMNPDIAFPGQRCVEVVRPMIHLLHPDNQGLQNFEALMCLTNIASLNDTARKRIVSEGGVATIEGYMYEEHEMIRRAATECMCNMILTEEVFNLYLGENDRVKLLVLYSGVDDMKLAKAASGALAMLSREKVICEKILQVKSWCEIFQVVCANEDADIQHRGLYTIMNVFEHSKELALKVVESSMFEVVLAITCLQEPERAQAKECAEACLEKAVEYELVKRTDAGESAKTEAKKKVRESKRRREIEKAVAEARLKQEEEEDAKLDGIQEEDSDIPGKIPGARIHELDEDELAELEEAEKEANTNKNEPETIKQADNEAKTNEQSES
ncbi:unnamed protein product [Owenia fusiformis]|uniref:Protein unc-45 homolog B n=1 Tax=Owenia fusiformis TaxID=6347 RepID=A0A8J1UWU3_OWEFU|nr:unnamed protein product [Owenia fusiformis]